MKGLNEAIERLDELEPGLRSLDTPLVLGEVISTKNKGEFQAGDFDFFIWGHSLDGVSVGAIVRTRHEGRPFPQMTQQQKKWIICSRGELKVQFKGDEKVLAEGVRLTIPPRTQHEIHPVSSDCSAIIITVPADPGMQK